MEPKGSLPHSQVPTTYPCPEPVQSIPWPHIPLPKTLLLRSYRSISPGPRLSVWTFRNKIHFCGEEFLAPPNPQAGGPPLVGGPRLLIQYIHSFLPYWSPFLHPQPEGTPCPLSLPVLPHIDKFWNWTHLFTGLNIMGFTVWMEPLLEFVPREIALVYSPGCFMHLAPVCVQVTWSSEMQELHQNSSHLCV